MSSEAKLVRIALDAMGGDNAPSEVVRGAVQFAAAGHGQVMLVGDPAALAQELEAYKTSRLPIGVVPSEGVISEEESPALALRQKPRASVLVATGMVRQGHADACVTMGSTGAAMAAGAVVLGLANGVERPALGGPVLGVAPNTCILDLGTNVDCRPRQLLSFGAIGDVFARTFFGADDPRIALLSVGAEAGKGNRQVRETTELFESSGLNFIGNIEANDLPKGKAEVVVCDGFVGNIVMKLTEGLGQYLSDHLRSRLEGVLPKDDLDLLVQEFHDLNNVVESRGGGPLLGVNGVSVVGHGAARADAVERALGTAKMAVETDFVSRMNHRLELLDSGLDD